jgi:hypothetical protein
LFPTMCLFAYGQDSFTSNVLYFDNITNFEWAILP